jgi:hypothetical protein
VRGRADGIRKAIAGGLSSIGSAILIGRSLKSYVQYRFRFKIRSRCGKTSALRELEFSSSSSFGCTRCHGGYPVTSVRIGSIIGRLYIYTFLLLIETYSLAISL